MVNGRTPLYVTLLAAALLAAVVLSFQPYSADWPGRVYTKPAQRYIRAAMHQDSAGLLRLSTSVSPVLWALEAARAHPDTLALWGRRVQAWIGERRGDTAAVFVYPAGEVCGEAPIVFRFVGSGSKARVFRASSACLDDPGREDLQADHRQALADTVLTLFDSLTAIHRDRPDTGLLRRLHPPSDTVLFIEGSLTEAFTGDSLFRRVLAAHVPVRTMTQRFSDRKAHLLSRRHALLTATETVDWVDTAGAHRYAGLLTLAVSRQGSGWVIRAYRGS